MLLLFLYILTDPRKTRTIMLQLRLPQDAIARLSLVKGDGRHAVPVLQKLIEFLPCMSFTI